MKKGILALVMTFGIILILVLSGPANALIIGLTISDNKLNKGEKTSFLVSLKLENGERPSDITGISLLMKGQASVREQCDFDVLGNIVSGCKGIVIKKLDSGDESGYGYGENQTLEYNMTLDTSEYLPLTYSTEIYAVINNKKVTFKGEDIEISGRFTSDCSVRGKQGSILVNEINFNNANSINFYIPLENAASGNGYITAQYKKSRFTYNFDVVRVIDSDDDMITLLVSGEYKLNLNKAVKNEAIIYLDKSTKSIDVQGEGFSVDGMKVTFIKGCL